MVVELVLQLLASVLETLWVRHAPPSVPRREGLEALGLREGWSVALSLDGPRVILRRALACRPRASDSEHFAAVLPGVARVEVGEG